MSLYVTLANTGTFHGKDRFYSIPKYLPLLIYTEYYRSLKFSADALDNLLEITYQEPLIGSSSIVISNTSRNIVRALNESIRIYKLETNGLELYLTNGIIYDKDYNILMCLTVDFEYLKDYCVLRESRFTSDPFYYYSTDFVGYDPFVMFVSTDLVHKSEYATFYRRLKKIYLDDCFEKGIEMRIVSSSTIRKNTFADNFKVHFNSLTELDEHLTRDLPHLLLTPLESFKTSEYPLRLGNPPIPIVKPTVNEVVNTPSQHRNLNSSDSMLEDSDIDEREFESMILQDNLDNNTSDTLGQMIDALEFTRAQITSATSLIDTLNPREYLVQSIYSVAVPRELNLGTFGHLDLNTSEQQQGEDLPF